MRFVLLIVMFSMSSCALFQPSFQKERVCSPNAVSYVKNSIGRSKTPQFSHLLEKEFEKTQNDIQACYNDFRRRTGKDQFQTCMVVGVDYKGQVEFYNFSSQEINSDRKFVECARRVTRKVPYQKYGKNYILVQSYRFY